MRAIIAAAALLLVTACGTEGPTGPAGPSGANIDRSKLYCDTVSGQATDVEVGMIQTFTQVAACRTVNDIPFTGSCNLAPTPGVSEFFSLTLSEARNWENIYNKPIWVCTWSPLPGAPWPLLAANFPARTEICCLSRP